MHRAILACLAAALALSACDKRVPNPEIEPPMHHWPLDGMPPAKEVPR